MIQLHRLEGFYWVAHTGGFARAVRAFPYPITAPAIYQQVRKLEHELGARLFERAGKDRLALTAAGRALFEFCRPFFVELPALTRALASGEHGGTLRIDAAALEVQHFLPRWLARLRLRRPDIRVHVEEVGLGDPQRVLTGESDLLVEHQPDVPNGLQGHRIGCYRAFLVAPRGRVASAATTRTAARALRELPFLGFHAAMPQRALQREGLRRIGLADARQVLAASSTEGLLAFVREGLGFSLLPWPDTRGPVDRRVDAWRLSGPGTEFPVVAMYRVHPPDPIIRAALDAITSA